MLFISVQKLFLFSRYLNFCLDFLVVQQNNLIRKIRLISNFMTSRSKGNQTMKFGQLIEYNMRNIFLEKSYTKCDGKTSPRPFSRKLKLGISLDQQSNKFYTVCFYCILHSGLWECIKTKLQNTCFYLILSIIKK